MKMSIVRGLFLFAAGAGCATVGAQMYYELPPTTVGEFREKGEKALRDLAEIGAYVRKIENSRTTIGLIACTPTPLPKMPEGAVDPAALRLGVGTVFALNEAHFISDFEPIQVSVDKCRPVGELKR